jgi:hypothetical protein
VSRSGEIHLSAVIGVGGNAETVAASIRHLAELGATSVAAQPTEEEPDLEGLIWFLGHEVQPLL